MQNDASKAQQEMFLMNQQQNRQDNNQQADLMGQRRTSAQQIPVDGMGASMNSQSQNNNLNAAFDTPFGMDNSVSSQRSSSRQPNQISGSQGASPLDVSSSQLGDKPENQGSNQKSFLDGSFAGGWQSNADLPDRRRIIFSILEVIRQMRPDTNKISQK
jgi:hypothetical protein